MTDFQRRAVEVGAAYEQDVARWLTERGWKIEATNHRHESGIELDILARDLSGNLVGIECKGGDRDRPGLLRSDNIWKVLGQTLVLYNWNQARSQLSSRLRFLVVTSAQPRDDERLADPLRIAEAEGQLTVVVIPSQGRALDDMSHPGALSFEAGQRSGG